MKKKTWKPVALAALSVLGLSILVLAVHIYVVTRPRPADAGTRAMARIDILQPVTQADADRITAWLYGQKGVDHVLVNPKTDIAVFTFFPIQTTADRIVSDFKESLPYRAERYVPDAAALKGGCPVASSSAIYRIYSWFKQIF
jgi:hypothetical protein